MAYEADWIACTILIAYVRLFRKAYEMTRYIPASSRVVGEGIESAVEDLLSTPQIPHWSYIQRLRFVLRAQFAAEDPWANKLHLRVSTFDRHGL